ncbi:ectoine hydroxylase-related dioxygenase (phytanoyl-CoA dioxygenase family) [Flavobacterium sp. 1]|uniref:phytanoyl-CoA dioxygenase family protein n=1 Tax=Flavobacterium sp. 1 TaxID=2035200 RepID=UPI000C2356DA|nr:phytanoyl-CoA dioxygenase family protein [Flavobacterium sp. 1]PJJ10954.1 ectoine hydroxylase-related dioxygenase (phytanoyl-CoA dioxygenase family) [Flavobacterium sp. 1]
MNVEKSYGVNNQTELNNLVDSHLEELQINGFSLLENVLDFQELSECRIRLDAVYEKQKEEFGEEKLKMINEQNLVRCPLVYDEYFLNLAINKKILEVVEKVIGNYFILHLQNGIINTENEEHHQSSWHRDLPYQNFVISKPLAIGALYCIDDFTNESGGTFVLPHSHRVESIPSSQYVEKYSKQIIAKAGSVILFDSMLFHRAGFNSSSFTRRAINNVYVVPILKQQINLYTALNGKYSEDEFLSKFLGYQSNTPSSDKEWRNNKFNR